jgi:hypothetical protein
MPLRRLTLTRGSSRSAVLPFGGAESPGGDVAADDSEDERLLLPVRDVVSDRSRGVVSETVA